MPDTTTPATPAVTTTPGWRTSEFWLKILAFILTVLLASGTIPTSGPLAQLAAIAATMLGALGYTVSRTLIKTNASSERTAQKRVDAAYASARQAQAGVSTLRMMASLAITCLALLCIGVQVASYSGCATVKADSSAMTGAFASCAKADLGRVVAGSGATLLGAVAAAIEGNTATLEDDLTKLATLVGTAGVECAIVAVETVLQPTPSSTPTTTTAAPGLLRAHTWIASRAKP